MQKGQARLLEAQNFAQKQSKMKELIEIKTKQKLDNETEAIRKADLLAKQLGKKCENI